MQKRGYFFELDAALALFVLVVGAFYISSYYIEGHEITQVGLLSDDLMNFLADTKIKDYDNPYAGIGGQLWRDGNITDPDNSLLQQASEFYSLGKKNLTIYFLSNVTGNVLPPQFRYEIWINNETLYPNDLSLEHNLSKNDTDLLLISRTITFGVLNRTTGTMWGPYKVEVYAWER